MMMIANDSQQLVHGLMFNAMGRYHRMRHAACGGDGDGDDDDDDVGFGGALLQSELLL